MNVAQSAADRWSASKADGCPPPPAARTGQYGFGVTKGVYGRMALVALVVSATSILFLGATASAARGATPRALTANPTCAEGDVGGLAERVCIYAHTTSFQVDLTGFPRECATCLQNAGGIYAVGVHTGTVINNYVGFLTSGYSWTTPARSDEYRGWACGRPSVYSQTICADFDLVIPGPSSGYRLSAANGEVFGAGNATVYGSLPTSPTTNPVVGIASTPDGNGYWEVARNGSVAAFGDAKSYNDLPGLHVTVNDIVAIAPTSDGKGYWLIGADGGEFAFGDAGYHGSLPGLHIHVDDIVGMVATPNGRGYILVGKDGGVFVFGGVYHGSLPGLHIRVDNIVGILPTGAETGYVLVGADGGSFVFGTGSGYYGSLPGRHIRVSDIVGIALTPDEHGYWMAGANATVYDFGDASNFGTPAGATSNLPITGIAGT